MSNQQKLARLRLLIVVTAAFGCSFATISGTMATLGVAPVPPIGPRTPV